MSSELIFPELSYKLMGILFEVHRSLGNQLQEKLYQEAFSQRLKQAGVPFLREFYLPIQDIHRKVGKYFLDFIVDNKIAIEFKATPALTDSQIRQLLGYLQVAKLKLGILANFRTYRLTYKRVINPLVKLVAEPI